MARTSSELNAADYRAVLTQVAAAAADSDHVFARIRTIISELDPTLIEDADTPAPELGAGQPEERWKRAYHATGATIETIVGRALGWYRERPGDPGYSPQHESYATGDHTPETMVAALAGELERLRASTHAATSPSGSTGVRRRRVSWVRDLDQVAQPSWNADPHQHPSQVHALAVLDDPSDARAWAGLASVYREQASTWQIWTKQQHGYAEALRRALADVHPGTWVEFGAGTGESYPALPDGQPVLHTDLLDELVAHAPARPGSTWQVADARELPVDSGSVDVLFGLNAAPALDEVNRVVSAGGSLVLAYSFGHYTPVYLDPEEVLDRLGSDWRAVAAAGTWGCWVRFTRADGEDSKPGTLCGVQNPDYPGEYSCTSPRGHGPILVDGDWAAHAAPMSGAYWTPPEDVAGPSSRAIAAPDLMVDPQELAALPAQVEAALGAARTWLTDRSPEGAVALVEQMSGALEAVSAAGVVDSVLWGVREPFGPVHEASFEQASTQVAERIDSPTLVSRAVTGWREHAHGSPSRT